MMGSLSRWILINWLMNKILSKSRNLSTESMIKYLDTLGSIIEDQTGKSTFRIRKEISRSVRLAKLNSLKMILMNFRRSVMMFIMISKSSINLVLWDLDSWILKNYCNSVKKLIILICQIPISSQSRISRQSKTLTRY